MSKSTHPIFPAWKLAEFKGIPPIAPLTSQQRDTARQRAGIPPEDFLATLIIGLRVNTIDPLRRKNIETLLRWIEINYGDLFDVLIVEQDDSPKFDLEFTRDRPGFRYEFLYNPIEYNRGWGYNVAVKNFSKNSKVIALLDTDVLTGSNFVESILDVHGHFDVVSPYRNIYYTDAAEATRLRRDFDLSALKKSDHIKNPVTLTGGIVIFKRDVYCHLNGFEQYLGYSSEDRAMDVTVFNHVRPEAIKICPDVYAHLFHSKDNDSRRRFGEIYAHLKEEYGCKYDPKIKSDEFIHANCKHAEGRKTAELIKLRANDFGRADLYSCGSALTINGQTTLSLPSKISRVEEVVFPPDFRGLADYEAREIFSAAKMHDESRIGDLYNKFAGERCFIIGNGPSLNRHDLSLLRNEYSFGVNSLYYKTRETGFTPTFYVVEDSSVMRENIAEIRNFYAPYKFFPTMYRSLHSKADNVFFFNMNRGFYEKSSPNYCVPRFSTDCSKVIYCGQSVTYINLQLAYFLGFTDVYLIGMDFHYVIPESHSRKGDVLTSDTDDPNHFHKDYFGKGKTWKDPKLDRVLMNYRQAKLSYGATGRRIFNATKGGHLEEFERVDYDSLFFGQSGKFKPAVAESNQGLCQSLGREGESIPAIDRIESARDRVLSGLSRIVIAGGSSEHILDEKLSADIGRLPEGDPVKVHAQKVFNLYGSG